MFRVRVPSLGQIRIEVFGGVGDGPAADSLYVSGPVIGDSGVLLAEHFLMKSASRVSRPSVFLASAVFSLILSMTGKINFQSGKAILLPVEFSRIPSNFKR